MKTNNQDSISLNKFISSTGICSRREADRWIENQRVKINGKIAIKGNRVFENDEVTVDGKKLKSRPEAIYIALNKPVGIVCTTDQTEKDNIIDFVNYPQRLFPIGRLDKPSEGLIFLTNDGDIVNKILRAGNNHEKEYIVHVDKPIGTSFVKLMSNGLPILGTVTKKCKVIKLSNKSFKIILTQGLNRQIRRMCNFLGYNVTKLKRTRIMNVTLQSIASGQYRYLTPSEIKEIHILTSASSKTEEASTMSSYNSRSNRKIPIAKK